MAQESPRLKCLIGLLNHLKLPTITTAAHVAASTSTSPVLHGQLVQPTAPPAVVAASFAMSGLLTTNKNSFTCERPFL